LEPRYVSTVDSGNLAAHLLTLGNACRAAAYGPVLDPVRFGGLRDAVLLVEDATSALADERRTQTVPRRDLAETCAALITALHEPPADPTEWAARVRQLALQADTPVDLSRGLTAERGDPVDSDVQVWALAARATIAGHERDLQTLLPWATVEASPAAPSALAALRSSSPTPGDLPDRCRVAIAEVRALRETTRREGPEGGEAIRRLDEAIDSLERSAAAADTLVGRLLAIAHTTQELADAMQFGFLFDPSRKIFSIGYRVSDGTLDASAYDLLASEARLASFIAIAKGDVPVSHWFHLG